MRTDASLVDRQCGHLSWLQLRASGWSEAHIKTAVRNGELVVVHDGVFAVGHVPTDPLARYHAAVLTTTSTSLAVHSAACLWDLRVDDAAYVTVVRPGSGGRKRIGDLLVLRSTTLAGELTARHGIPTTTAARTIIDLAGHLPRYQLDRMVRDAIRLKHLTPAELRAGLVKHRGRRGVATLREVVGQYELLRVEATKSNAEAEAVVLLAVHGRPAPEVNVLIAGKEADLVWRDERLIIELDGPQWHLFAEIDRHKDAIWRAAGWRVERLPTDDVFHHPERLLALAPPRRTSVHGADVAVD